ncbi:MAG TPA: ROK family protein [Kofleriaceae bacterium]|nr:ROK family protein [Kofleriaceae bacterium]
MKIGIDLGGTNLRAAIIEDEVRLRDHSKEPVGEPRDPTTIVARCAELVERLSAGESATVGIGLAAMLRGHSGMVANSPHLRWLDIPFGELLAQRLGSRFKVGVYNDVNAIVYGEYMCGSARGFRNVLGVYVGTGIGGGMIVNGELVEGASNCAGEIGHTKVRWDDAAAPCACGKRGCVEAYVGGSYVQRRILEELSAGARSSAVTLAGGIENVNAGHVDMAAADGDEWALGLWQELAPLLAVTLGNAMAVLNPERLVLGGGVLGRCPTLYAMTDAALMVVGNQPTLEACTIAQAELGDDAGIIGAAHLASRDVSIVAV